MLRPAMCRVDQLHYSDVLDSVAQGRGQDRGRSPLFTVPRTCSACVNCTHYYQLADQYYFFALPISLSKSSRGPEKGQFFENI